MGEGYFLHTGMLWVKQLRIGETCEDTFLYFSGFCVHFGVSKARAGRVKRNEPQMHTKPQAKGHEASLNTRRSLLRNAMKPQAWTDEAASAERPYVLTRKDHTSSCNKTYGLTPAATVWCKKRVHQPVHPPHSLFKQIYAKTIFLLSINNQESVPTTDSRS